MTKDGACADRAGPTIPAVTKLYAQYMRPHLVFTYPWKKGDKEVGTYVLEKVQKRAIGMDGLGLSTLQELRHQQYRHMIQQVYQILQKKEKVNSET